MMAQTKTDNVEFVKDCYAEADQAYSGESGQIARMQRCLNNFYGNQWLPADVSLAALSKRPCLTLNIIKPTIKTVAGLVWQNRLQTRCIGVGDTDAGKADIMSKVVKYVEEHNNANVLDSAVFLMGIIAGVGLYYVDYIGGEVTVLNENPLNFMLDPGFERYDLSDCGYGIRVRWMTERMIKNLFGKKDLDFGELDRNYMEDVKQIANSNLTVSKRYKVLEGIFRKYDDTFTIKGEGFSSGPALRGSDVRLPDGRTEKIERLEGLNGLGFTAQRKREPHIHITTVIGDYELTDGVTPFFDNQYLRNTLPFFAFMPNFLFGKRSGIVEDMLDLQREKNLRRSQMLHLINQSANSGWFYAKGSVNPQILKDFGSRPGVTVEVEEGYEYGKNVGRISPMQVPSYVEAMETKAEQDARLVTGISDILNSATGGRDESGRAIALRQQQGMTVIQNEIQSFIETKRLLSKFLVGAIQAKMTGPQILRITGESQEIGINLPQPVIDPQTGQILKDTMTGDPIIGEILNDMSIGKYDVIVDEIPASPSFRQTNYEMYKEMFQMFGPNIIPPSFVLRASDVPGKDELADRAKMFEDVQLMQAQMQMAQMQAMMQQGIIPPQAGTPGMPQGGQPGNPKGNNQPPVGVVPPEQIGQMPGDMNNPQDGSTG